jgi:anti-sigma B factor antagonist
MSDPSNVIADVTTADAPDGKAVIVALGGEIDLQHSPQVRVRLIEEAKSMPARLVVDLSGVTYMDSSGVASLVEGMQRVRAYGGQMMLVGPSDRVRSIFEIAKLDTIFSIVATREEALGG